MARLKRANGGGQRSEHSSASPKNKSRVTKDFGVVKTQETLPGNIEFDSTKAIIYNALRDKTMKNKLLLIALPVLLIASCAVNINTGEGTTEATSQATTSRATTEQHDHVYSTRTIAPTCEEKGYTLHFCECGAAYVDDWKEPMQHIFNRAGYCERCGFDEYGNAAYSSGEQYFAYSLSEDQESYIITGKEADCPHFIELPETHNEKPVTAIAANAFANDEGLYGVKIPEGYVELGFLCFDACLNMREIYIPDTVEIMEEGVFRYCEGLTIYLESDREKPGYYRYDTEDYGIGTAASGWNNSSRPVVYGHRSHGRTSDGFLYAKGISHGENYLVVTGYVGNDANPFIPETIGNETVSAIGDSAFCNKGNIVTISIPETVKSIGRSCFQYCESLKRISFPYRVQAIPDYCFFGCGTLESFVLSPSIKSIGACAFLETGLRELYVPATVDVIASSAFVALGDPFNVFFEVDEPKEGYAFDPDEPYYIFGVKNYFGSQTPLNRAI